MEQKLASYRQVAAEKKDLQKDIGTLNARSTATSSNTKQIAIATPGIAEVGAATELLRTLSEPQPTPEQRFNTETPEEQRRQNNATKELQTQIEGFQSQSQAPPVQIATTTTDESLKNQHIQVEYDTVEEQSRQNAATFNNQFQKQVETLQSQQETNNQEFQKQVAVLKSKHAAELKEVLAAERNQHQQHTLLLQNEHAAELAKRHQLTEEMQQAAENKITVLQTQHADAQQLAQQVEDTFRAQKKNGY